MLVAILGIIDIISGLILLFGAGISFPSSFLAVLGLILLAKSSLGMFKDFGSWIDFLAGLILLLSIIVNMPTLISVIIGLLILQKGAFSLFYTPI